MSTPTPVRGTTARKPYRAPRLVEYGDVRAITQTVGAINKNDGGGGKTKTG
jgi:hypothetical protein